MKCIPGMQYKLCTLEEAKKIVNTQRFGIPVEMYQHFGRVVTVESQVYGSDHYCIRDDGQDNWVWHHEWFSSPLPKLNLKDIYK